MGKQCKKCGSYMPNEARFCQSCGSAEFINDPLAQQQPEFNRSIPEQAQPVINQAAPNQQQGVYNQSNLNQQGVYGQENLNQQQGQSWQPPVPQVQPKKKKKTGLIIGIVAAVIAVLIIVPIVSVLVSKTNSSSSDYSSGNYSGSDDIISSIGYTKGYFDGAVYTNEWADIKLPLPWGYSNADAETYADFNYENEECGFYFVSDDASGTIYCYFEKLPTYPAIDEEAYLDAAIKNFDNEIGLTVTAPDSYSTSVIAGCTYSKAEIILNNGLTDFYDTVYVRKLGGYMVAISVLGQSFEANDALAHTITTVN